MKQMLIAYHTQFMREQLIKIVERCGYSVIGQVNSGLEAIETYKNLKPDIVAIDSIMPDLDVIEIINRIKKYDQRARIIIISSLGNDPKIKEAILAGAIGYIVNPYKPL